MDGRPAGRFTFEITDAKIEAATSRRPLTEAELYERLNASFAVLRRSGRDKRDLDTAAAFRPVPDTGRLYTVVAAIDSADSVRAILADRSTHELNSLVDWNRHQQWAVLSGPVSKGSTLAVRAADTPVKIGIRWIPKPSNREAVAVVYWAPTIGSMRDARGRSKHSTPHASFRLKAEATNSGCAILILSILTLSILIVWLPASAGGLRQAIHRFADSITHSAARE
jgi:hypothetical protein